MLSIDRFITQQLRRRINRITLMDHADWPSVPRHPITLYLHIPFCESLCHYCTFHRQKLDIDLATSYFNAIRMEILAAKENGFDFNEVYIGGGTPTVLIDELTQTIDLIKQLFRSPTISVETNPNHLDDRHMLPLIEVGIDRLSVGVQTFNDQLLLEMNRQSYGSSQEIQKRIKKYQYRFSTFNLDMIFNLPGQVDSILQQDIDIVLKLKAPQISWYPLMPITNSHSIDDAIYLHTANQEANFYHQIEQRLESAYKLSSAWCFSSQEATFTDEYITHSAEYLGLGSGAFSQLNQQLLISDFSINKYIQNVMQGRTSFIAKHNITSLEFQLYQILLGFFAQQVEVPSTLSKRRILTHMLISALASNAYIQKFESGYRVTSKGRYFSLVLMKEFLKTINELRTRFRQPNNISKPYWPN